MIKVHDRKKAPPYLTPLNGGFKMRPAIRESEREAFLSDGDLASGHVAISWVRSVRRASTRTSRSPARRTSGRWCHPFGSPWTCVR